MTTLTCSPEKVVEKAGEGIKPLVVALLQLGFPVTSSCEGRLSSNPDERYPWVRVEGVLDTLKLNIKEANKIRRIFDDSEVSWVVTDEVVDGRPLSVVKPKETYKSLDLLQQEAFELASILALYFPLRL